MIKNIPIRLNADSRGFISSGRKGPDGRPTSIEGFDLSDFAELEAIYGKDPKKVFIAFPVNDLAAICDDEYSAWATTQNGSSKKRVCDGEECVHRIDETFCGQKFVAGETSECFCTNLPEGDKQKCRYAMVLRVMFLHPETMEYISPTVYTFRNHSIHSGSSIRMELIKALGITGRLAGHQFELTCRFVTSAKRANSKFPLWSLLAIKYSDAPAMLGDAERLQLTTGNDLADVLEDDDTVAAAEPVKAPTPSAEKKPAAPNGAKKEAAPAKQSQPAANEKHADVRSAADIRAAAQSELANAPKGAADAPTHAKVLAQLGILTGNTEKRILAVIAYLFGATETTELSNAEALWLMRWIQPVKAGDQWRVPNVTVQEAKNIFAAAAVELAALFDDKPATTTTEQSSAPDPNEPFPDGMNAYGEPVDPQQGLALGTAKPQLDPATM